MAGGGFGNAAETRMIRGDNQFLPQKRWLKTQEFLDISFRYFVSTKVAPILLVKQSRNLALFASNLELC